MFTGRNEHKCKQTHALDEGVDLALSQKNMRKLMGACCVSKMLTFYTIYWNASQMSPESVGISCD